MRATLDGVTGADDTVAGAAAPGSRDRRARAFAIGVVVLVLAGGLALRLWLTLGPLRVTDSDEAITGLMARDLLHGHVSTYFWGQHYGGSLEIVPIAISFLVFGMSTWSMRLPALIEIAICSFLIWRIGLRLYDPRRAVFAALAFWIAPAAYVWFFTRELLFYVPTLTLGLVFLLCAQRIAEDVTRTRDWLIAGFAFGLGWWLGPNILYFVLPAAIWLVLQRGFRPLLRGFGYALPAALVGAVPWLYTNLLRVRLDSVYGPTDHFSRFASIREIGSHRTPGAHLHSFFYDGIPAELGLRSTLRGQWVGGAVHTLLYAVAAAVLVAALILALRARGLDGIALVVAPLLYILSPFPAGLANGRYFFYLAAFVPLVLARLVFDKAMIAVLAVPMLVLTGIGAVRLADVGSEIGVVPDLRPVISALDATHTTRVNAPYWTAFRLTFESDARIIAAPTYFNRHPEYRAEVARVRPQVYVFVSGVEDRDFAATLAAKHETATRRRAGRYTIWTVTPAP